MNADRAGLFAIGERREQISQLGVGALRGDEPLDVIAPVPGGAVGQVSASRGMAERKAPGLRVGKAKSGRTPNPPGFRREY